MLLLLSSCQKENRAAIVRLFEDFFLPNIGFERISKKWYSLNYKDTIKYKIKLFEKFKLGDKKLTDKANF